jgi:hypothetical protein
MEMHGPALADIRSLGNSAADAAFKSCRVSAEWREETLPITDAV